MSKLREAWKKMSLKKKIIVMTMYAIVMTACVLFFSTIVFCFSRLRREYVSKFEGYKEYRANILASRKN